MINVCRQLCFKVIFSPPKRKKEREIPPCVLDFSVVVCCLSIWKEKVKSSQAAAVDAFKSFASSQTRQTDETDWQKQNKKTKGPRLFCPSQAHARSWFTPSFRPVNKQTSFMKESHRDSAPFLQDVRLPACPCLHVSFIPRIQFGQEITFILLPLWSQTQSRQNPLQRLQRPLHQFNHGETWVTRSSENFLKNRCLSNTSNFLLSVGLNQIIVEMMLCWELLPKHRWSCHPRPW